jgi:hypothetical protein
MSFLSSLGMGIGDFLTNTTRGMLSFFSIGQYKFESIADTRKRNVQETGNYQGVPRGMNTALDIVNSDKSALMALVVIVALLILKR